MADRNTLSIVDGALVVEPRGLDKLWGCRRQVVAPVSAITEVLVELHPLRVPTGWRGPGLDVGGKLSGTFHPGNEQHYWNVSGRGPALEVVIAGGSPFHRLYLSVADPEASRAWLAAEVEAVAAASA